MERIDRNEIDELPSAKRASRIGPGSTRAMTELAEDFRTALVLRDICGFDYAEIAELTNSPVGNGEVPHRPAPGDRWPNGSGTQRQTWIVTRTAMTDDRIDELASAYLDGELDAAGVAEAEAGSSRDGARVDRFRGRERSGAGRGSGAPAPRAPTARQCFTEFTGPAPSLSTAPLDHRLAATGVACRGARRCDRDGCSDPAAV
jgi:hypothetical protein